MIAALLWCGCHAVDTSAFPDPPGSSEPVDADTGGLAGDSVDSVGSGEGIDEESGSLDTGERASEDSATPDGLHVFEEDDFGRVWSCPEDYRDCVEDYLALGTLAAEHARPISSKDLYDQIDSIAAGEVPLVEESMSSEALEAVVREGLNIDFLLDGLDGRKLTVTRIAEISHSDYTEHQLLFTDPWVGEFFGILLVPTTGSAPHPVIMTVHGHGQRAESPLDFMFGREYPTQGYAVLSLTYRVMHADSNEHEVTEALLLSGFTFETLRIYETLLGLKYLRYREDMGAMGIVAHSGGASANNLAMWMESPLSAYVYDLEATYYGAIGEHLTDEMIPALYPYHLLLNAIDQTAVPSLVVPYGYAEEFDEIVSFMNAHL